MLFDGREMKAAPLDPKVNMEIGEQESLIADMFRQYFKSISVEHRKNPRLQRQFLPIRYRETMLEVAEND
jgi:hypothetical protein